MGTSDGIETTYFRNETKQTFETKDPFVSFRFKMKSRKSFRFVSILTKNEKVVSLESKRKKVVSFRFSFCFVSDEK